MIIQKTKGQAKLQQGRWLIHGPGKIGKSTFASGFPNNLFIATERRLEHIPNINYVFVDSWKEFKSIVKDLNNTSYKKQYSMVTIDVIDHLWSYCVSHTCARLGIEHQSDEGFGKAWDAVDKEFKDSFFKLLSYPYGMIIISHTQSEEIKSLRETHIRYSLGLPKRARRIVIPFMGVIGYIDYDEFKINQNGKAKLVKGRSIRFKGDEEIEAADGEGYLPSKVRLFKDANKTYAAIKSYYEHSSKEED